jgi:hypothetical protein
MDAQSTADAARVGINVALYPITLASAVAALPPGAAEIATTGCVVLPGFLTREATAAMADEGRAEADTAWVTNSEHTAWQQPLDPGCSATHVRNQLMRTRVASVPFDKVGPALRALYGSDALLALVEAVLGRPRGSLHRLADPLGACSINVFRPGALVTWYMYSA